MITIGITGIIGSGKSTASALFKKRGVPVIDLDVLAKETLALQDVHNAIEADLGPGFVTNGEVNIEKLRDAVFVDKEKLRKLEAITHPRILDQMWQTIREHADSGEPAVIIDGPLLFETGLYKKFDKTIVVAADMEVVRKRLKIRGMDASDIEKRISHQIPLGEKEKVADYVLLNNGTKEDLEREIDTVMERMNNGR